MRQIAWLLVLSFLLSSCIAKFDNSVTPETAAKIAQPVRFVAVGDSVIGTPSFQSLLRPVKQDD